MERAEQPVRSLAEEIERLGPWHQDVAVAPGVSTRPGGARLKERWARLMGRIYRDGLGGRTLLDCACNCGGYSFWARELGASRTFGFDAREHWIEQARFLQAHRSVAPTDNTTFEVLDLYDLPNRGLEPFDIVMFKGIFYHLPDPITGIKIAADLTKELIFVDTGIRRGLPDGMLVLEREGTKSPMSGIHGLNWRPTGPKVLMEILDWLGFKESRVIGENARDEKRGRIGVIASRERGLLRRLPVAASHADQPSPED